MRCFVLFLLIAESILRKFSFLNRQSRHEKGFLLLKESFIRPAVFFVFFKWVVLKSLKNS